VYWRAAEADQRDRDAGCVFAPALWSSSSASKAGPVIMAVGAVTFRLAWRRCRRGCRCLRESPNARARRAIGSPVAIPRSHSPKVDGRCRVFAQTVPVSRVS
jgi:hypothetical protein